MSNNTPYQCYRRSTLGQCLSDSLQDLRESGIISEELLAKTESQFDRSMNNALSTQVTAKMSFKGHLHTFRFCDDVWTLILENANFKTENDNLNIDLVKIVACEYKKDQDAQD